MSVLANFKLVELITTRTEAVVTFISGNLIKFNRAALKRRGGHDQRHMRKAASVGRAAYPWAWL